MDTELRPLGLGFSLIGNLAYAVGFGRAIGLVASVEEIRLSVSTVFEYVGPLGLLAFGYLLIRLAPRFGGGSFGVQFLVIGVTSLLNAVHATDGVERFVGFTIGGTFLAVSVFGLIAAWLSFGLRGSLLHAGPVVSVRGPGGAQVLNVDTLAGAIKLAQQLQGEPQASPAMFTVDRLQPEQRQQILDQSESLRSSGKISDAQYEALQQWSGLTPKDPELRTRPAGSSGPGSGGLHPLPADRTSHPVTAATSAASMRADASRPQSVVRVGAFARMPRWGWAIAGLVVAIVVATFVGERVDPKSGLIEDMGRSQIARATGHQVSSIECERKAQIRTDMDLPCRVRLADGTTFDTVAHVSVRFENAAQYHYRATFSPLPAGSHAPPAAAPGRARSPDDASQLVACLQAAGTDNAKLQACTAKF